MGENMTDKDYRISPALDSFPEPFSASVPLQASSGKPPAEVREKYPNRFKPGQLCVVR